MYCTGKIPKIAIEIIVILKCFNKIIFLAIIKFYKSIKQHPGDVIFDKQNNRYFCQLIESITQSQMILSICLNQNSVKNCNHGHNILIK